MLILYICAATYFAWWLITSYLEETQPEKDAEEFFGIFR